MVERLPELKTDSSQTKTGSTTNKNKGPASGRKRSRKDGVELLRRAADRCLVRNSEQLADRLSDKALKGDLACTKALVDLAESKTPQPKRVKKWRGPSLAERWAAEPQWEGPEEEEEE